MLGAFPAARYKLRRTTSLRHTELRSFTMVGPLISSWHHLFKSVFLRECTAGRLMRSSVLGGRADIDFDKIPEYKRILDGAPKHVRVKYS